MATHPHVFTDAGGVDRTQVAAVATPGHGIFVGGAVPADPSKLVRKRLVNGASASMVVDGTTEKSFTFTADPTSDIVLYELRLLFAAPNMDFDGLAFGDKKDALQNGVLVDVVVNGGQSAEVFEPIKTNTDFLFFASNPGVAIPQVGHGPQDALVSSLSMGGAWTLRAGTADLVRIKIRDDLTKRKIDFFQAQVWGVKL
jgi:hypothetical protein